MQVIKNTVSNKMIPATYSEADGVCLSLNKRLIRMSRNMGVSRVSTFIELFASNNSELGMT